MFTINGTHQEGGSSGICGVSLPGKEFRRALVVPSGSSLGGTRHGDQEDDRCMMFRGRG